MSGSTRIVLAIIGAVVGVLIIYYGFLMPDPIVAADGTSPDPALGETSQTPPAIQDPVADGELFSSVPQGLLSSTLPDPDQVAGGQDVLPRDTTPAPALEPVPQPVPQTITMGQGTTNASAPVANQPAQLGAPTAQPTTYVVKPNDTLSHIALAWFGDETKWNLIVAANPGLNPNRIRVGQKLILPSTSTPARPVGPTNGQNNSTSVIHTVQQGDSLSVISRIYYGSDVFWRRVYLANRATLGDDPDALRIGMKIIVPPSPNATDSPRMR